KVSSTILDRSGTVRAVPAWEVPSPPHRMCCGIAGALGDAGSARPDGHRDISEAKSAALHRAVTHGRGCALLAEGWGIWMARGLDER
ncbi:MAG: hypothetical protein ACK5U3_01080, partial [Pseudomonadota bacterium]